MPLEEDGARISCVILGACNLLQLSFLSIDCFAFLVRTSYRG